MLGFAGWSGSGKTTLIERLIPVLRERGLTVSLVKHAHHDFDIDLPGKDSWRHRKAGALEVLVCSDQRWALMHELRGAAAPTLHEHLRRLAPCDLVLVEGFKRDPVPKIEIRRSAHPAPLLAPADSWIIAIASDLPLAGESLPVLDLDDIPALADFVTTWLARRRCAAAGSVNGAGTC